MLSHHLCCQLTWRQLLELCWDCLTPKQSKSMTAWMRAGVPRIFVSFKTRSTRLIKSKHTTMANQMMSDEFRSSHPDLQGMEVSIEKENATVQSLEEQNNESKANSLPTRKSVDFSLPQPKRSRLNTPEMSLRETFTGTMMRYICSTPFLEVCI